MYEIAHRSWVTGLVRQSGTIVAIYEAGSDCGIPYAPDVGLTAG